MANEAKKIYATVINHIVNGAQVNATAISASSDVDTAITSTNSLDYPVADVILTATFASAPTANGTIDLYRQDQDIVSTNDETAPTTTYKPHYVGTFVASGATTEYFQLSGVPLTKNCSFYILNNTSQNINNTWDLDVVPWTMGTA